MALNQPKQPKPEWFRDGPLANARERKVSKPIFQLALIHGFALGFWLTGCAATAANSTLSAKPTQSVSTLRPDIEPGDVKAQDLPAIHGAARRGDPTALVKLAISYGYGIGVKADPDKYLLFMARAAKLGNAQAQDTFGQVLIERSPALAIPWFERAAAQHYSSAEYDLGLAYLVGRGVKANEGKACTLFRESAEQDYDLGEYSIGTCYYDGVGLTRNTRAALHWYRKAADQDLPQAEEGLAEMYATGDPVQRNLTESLKWTLLAKGGPANEVDHQKLGHLIALLEQQMTSNEVAAAQRRADSFRRTHNRHESTEQLDYSGNVIEKYVDCTSSVTLADANRCSAGRP